MSLPFVRATLPLDLPPYRHVPRARCLCAAFSAVACARPGGLRQHQRHGQGQHRRRAARRDRHGHSVERGTADTVVTNDSGFYVKDRLLPGTYEVQRRAVRASSRRALPSVNVSVDTQTQVDFTLALGELSETVEVTGGSPLLKTDRADVATTFDTRQVTELPVLDRNFTKFVLLTPGTQQLGWQHAASENPQGSTQTMVNGQHFSGTSYQLDGTENRDPILGIIVINPTLESIGETKITSQNYDAEFGQATAGVVSVQTKSGANDVPRQRLRVLPERQVPGAQSVHAVRRRIR